MYKWCGENWYNNRLSIWVTYMKSHVLNTVWCNITGKAPGEIWTWSLGLGVKRLTFISIAVCDPYIQPTGAERGGVPRRPLAGEEVPMVNLRRVCVDHGGFCFGDAVLHVHQRSSEAAAPALPDGVQSDDEIPCQLQLVHVIPGVADLFRLPADGRLPEVQCGWWVSCLNQTRVTGSTCWPHVLRLFLFCYFL